MTFEPITTEDTALNACASASGTVSVPHAHFHKIVTAVNCRGCPAEPLKKFLVLSKANSALREQPADREVVLKVEVDGGAQVLPKVHLRQRVHLTTGNRLSPKP